MSAKESSMATTLALLERLKGEMPELMDSAQVVGRWVWIEFHTPPLQTIRAKLKELGFHWNGQRKCWQNPCGVSRPRATRYDPRMVYRVVPATEMQLNEDFPAATSLTKEFKVVALRECPVPEDMLLCDTPQKAADYWRLHVETNPYFNPECECFALLMLNTRRRVKGHQVVSTGTLDTLLVHPREVFKTAIAANASAILLVHNLCAATHKLCYVARRFMCSHRLVGLTLTRALQRKEGYA